MYATKPSFPASSSAWSLFRGRSVLILTVAATAAAVTFKYKSDAYRKNEQLQKLYKAPGGYVSVDRSGGGI